MVPFSVILSDPSATFQSFNDKHSRAASLRQLSFLFLMPRSALRCSMYIILARYCPPRWYVRVRTPPRGSDRVESICYSKFSKKNCPPRGSVSVRTPPLGSDRARSTGYSQFKKNCLPRGSVSVRTPPLGSDRTRSTGYSQFSKKK